MDKYNKNANSSDFKRYAGQDNTDGDQGDHQDGDDGSKVNEKAGEYVKELLSEKIKLNKAKFPISSGLIDQETTKVQATGRTPDKDNEYLDVYRDKVTKVTVKVLVPVKEHPKFNFVGKLLGPKGNTLKQLQEETMCKISVLGRGSMRDRHREDDFRNSLDPKLSHLTDELHVKISAIAPPAEAHARIAYALAEIKKYLLPDLPDMERGRPVGPPGHPPSHAPPRMPPAPIPRSMPQGHGHGHKTKVSSQSPQPPIRAPPRASEPEFNSNRASVSAMTKAEDEACKMEKQDQPKSTRLSGSKRCGANFDCDVNLP